MVMIETYDLQFVREPLQHAFAFKGGSLSELWQITCRLTNDRGDTVTGYGVQSVLWSDGAIFAELGQEAGNEAMLAVTRRALELLKGMELKHPAELQRQLLPGLMSWARVYTGRKELRTTFVLNALTPVDWALWKLWRLENGAGSFEEVTGLCETGTHMSLLGNIPLLTYGTEPEEIISLAESGIFLFKIKIGSNPGGRNDPEEMLAWDIARMKQIHELLKDYETPYTDCGHPAYYLDANGRYDTRERMLRFLQAAEEMGALERIVLLEEPFPENAPCFVGDFPVVVAGDESAHSAEDAVRLIDTYGYKAIALKPIAKTLSVSLEVLREATKRNVGCFCADLTVNPKMVEMNKLFAAHLPPIRGLKAGVVESNGPQNYKDWEGMLRAGGLGDASWARQTNGVYRLSPEYYACDGRIWAD